MPPDLKYYLLTDKVFVKNPFAGKYPLTVEKIFEQTETVLKGRFKYGNDLIVEIDSNPTITLIRSNRPIVKSDDGNFTFKI